MPILSIKNSQASKSEAGFQMMTIEDNNDLRAVMNFTQNALNRVLHVFVITHDAPNSKAKNEVKVKDISEEKFS
jgi:hypothetical protein